MSPGTTDSGARRDACLGDDELARLVDGASPGIDDALAHAAECGACRELLAMVARLRAAERDAEETAPPQQDTRTQPAASPTSHRSLQPGQQVGRFVIERAVGEGGMGIVFCADDTTLQRRVAIKFLHIDETDAHARKRLLREARAMARVDHPNVVRVYEASAAGELAYIVMEFVDGMDLRHWLRAAPRTGVDVVHAYAQAGRGLAAAHDHGLVHRDFKPHNVLVARDGRVLVTDFGLARPVDAPQLVDGALAGGTPRYMAPEQQEDGEVGPAADQFAFCTALREALLEPQALTVPPALNVVLARGTERKPEARFDTMHTLVRELDRIADAPRRRRRMVLGALVLVAVFTLGFGVGTGLQRDECAAPDEGDFAGLWDHARRSSIQTVLSTPQAGEEGWAKVSAVVDAYTERWSALRHEACAATRLRSEVSEDVLDRRMACLRRGRFALQAMVDLLESGDEKATSRAVELAHALPGIDRCNEIIGSDAGPPPPADPVMAARLLAAEGELAAVRALIVTGESEPAWRRVQVLRDEAESIGWAPLLAEVLVAASRAQADLDVEGACETSRLAYRAAVASGSDTLAYQAAIGASSRHVFAGRIEDAELFLGLAEAHVDRLGAEPVPGKLASAHAAIARRRGDMQGALALLEESERLTAADPNRLHDLAGVLGDIGGTLAELGRLREAAEATERAVEAATKAFGPDQHRTLALRANLAHARQNDGMFREAQAELETVLELQRRAGSPLLIATSLTMLASTLRAQLRYEEAYARDEEALALREAALGEDHPLLVESLLKLASDDVPLGRIAPAVASLRRAITIARTLPYDYPLLDLYAELAYAHEVGGDVATALATMEEGLDVWRGVDVENQRVLRFEYRYGRVLELNGRADEAVPLLRHALVLAEKSGVDYRTTAFTHYQLGRALWGTGARDEARAHVEQARAMLDARDDRKHETWDQIVDWLDNH